VTGGAGPRDTGKGAPVDFGDDGLEDAVEIGRGAFAVVYRAHQQAFDRTVAVKVLTGSLDERALDRLGRERRAMGALSSHPNIVAIYDSGDLSDGRPYIVMEYAPDGSLADRVAQRGPLPWAEAVDIGVKLSDALGAAHKAGVLHRDIKPENVLVSAYGEPMLADFGIAQLAGKTATRTGVVTASLAHAAPEILEGARPSEAADIYSLASTLHELISGQAPFVRDTDESMIPVIARVATEPPPDLRGRGVPDAVSTALEQGMAKAPGDRPATAAEFGESLRKAREGAGVAGKAAGKRATRAAAAAGAATAAPAPAKAVARSSAGRPRRGLVVAGAAVAAVAIAVGAVVALSGGGGDDGGKAGGGAPADNNTGTVTPITVQSPGQIAVGEGAAWVETDSGAAATGTGVLLSRIDPKADSVSATADVGGTFSPALAVGDGSVFVVVPDLVAGTAELVRVDAATNAETGRVSVPENTVAAVTGGGALWVVASEPGADGQFVGSLLRVGLEPFEVTDRVPIGTGPNGVAFGGGNVWVTESSSGSLFKIDPDNLSPDSFDTVVVGRAPMQVEFEFGHVWVLDAADGKVLEVDPDSGNTVAEGKGLGRSLGEASFDDVLAVGLGAVYVLDADQAELLVIDASTLKVAVRVPVGRFPRQVAVGEGSVWVTDTQDNTVFRVKT